MNQANNGRFLGLLGFLGFRGSQQYSHLANLAFLLLLSLGALLVFFPLPRSKVRITIEPRKKVYDVI
jgi:hypothetical protein